MQWVIQTSGLRYDEIIKTHDALLEVGGSIVDVGFVLGSDDISNIESVSHEPNTVFMGSCKLIKLISQSEIWTPGVFFDVNKFDNAYWDRKLGSHMLNSDMKIMPLKDVEESFDCKRLFLRPSGDLKAFAGLVVDREGISPWIEEVRSEGRTLDDSLMVAASSIKTIGREWRCFVVNGQVISGSQYMNQGTVIWEEDFPQEVQDYAQSIANIWLPHENVVLDVAELTEGFKVIEFNCINGSGWYKSDRIAVLNEIKSYLEIK